MKKKTSCKNLFARPFSIKSGSCDSAWTYLCMMTYSCSLRGTFILDMSSSSTSFFSFDHGILLIFFSSSYLVSLLLGPFCFYFDKRFLNSCYSCESSSITSLSKGTFNCSAAFLIADHLIPCMKNSFPKIPVSSVRGLVRAMNLSLSHFFVCSNYS